MTTMTIKTNAPQVAVEIAKSAGQVDNLLTLALISNGRALRRRIQQNASGRPGPNVIPSRFNESVQGRGYRASWKGKFRLAGRGATYTVYTDEVRSRRLEFGFVGVDSLGRLYNQPPFPHIGPAVDFQAPVFHRETEMAVSRWVSEIGKNSKGSSNFRILSGAFLRVSGNVAIGLAGITLSGGA